MELAPGVYSLGVHKGFATHAFLIAEEDGFTLIDTLFDADGLVIADQIRALGGTLADLKRIVVTHAHRSHLGGLAALKRLSGATVYSHAWEADIIAGERAAQQVSWWPQDPIVTYHFQVANNLNISRHRPCRVDEYVAGGERLGRIEVVHAPGHTPGHLAFWLAGPTHPVCRRCRGHLAQADGGLAGLRHQPAPARRVAAQARRLSCRHRGDRSRRAHPPRRSRRAAEPGRRLVLNQAAHRYSINASSRARLTARTRPSTPSLAKMWLRCDFTVPSVITSSSAISWLE